MFDKPYICTDIKALACEQWNDNKTFLICAIASSSDKCSKILFILLEIIRKRKIIDVIIMMETKSNVDFCAYAKC